MVQKSTMRRSISGYKYMCTGAAKEDKEIYVTKKSEQLDGIDE